MGLHRLQEKYVTQARPVLRFVRVEEMFSIGIANGEDEVSVELHGRMSVQLLDRIKPPQNKAEMRER